MLESANKMSTMCKFLPKVAKKQQQIPSNKYRGHDLCVLCAISVTSVIDYTGTELEKASQNRGPWIVDGLCSTRIIDSL